MAVRVAGRAVLAVGLVLGALALTGGPASASDPDDSIPSMDVLIDLASDGVAHVTVDLTVDFGPSPNHGPYLTWITRERFDDERDREYRISHVTASSATAPAGVQTQEETLGTGRGTVTVRAFLIGDEDVTITGQHSYTVTFDVEGWVNAADFDWPADAPRPGDRDAGRGPAAERESDELYLDVVAGWEIPVRDVNVQVTGPADVADVACYDTFGQPDPCDSASANGPMASFTQAALGTGQPLTIAVAYPRGTFAGVEPVLSYPWSAARAFALNPGTVLGALGVSGVGAVVMLRRLRRTGWDEQFLGLTPGVLPAPGQEVQVGAARKREPVAVRFTPPEGFRAGQLGTLVDSTADPHDVTATIIDLAVRGHLRISQIDEGTDWLLERTIHPTDDLLPYEATLLGRLFRQRASVQLDDLKETFAESMATVQSELYRDVTERGWFRRDPSAARSAWAGRGVVILLLGVAATVALAVLTQWAVVGLGLVLVGIVWLLATGAAPARTAAGTAVLAQAEGFRLYLATAEADQLRFEEGEDLFSRYLPFAVAFGLTERWARLFEQLAAQGRRLTEPSWYVGYGNLPFWAMAGSLGRDLSSFTSSMDTALTAVPQSTGAGVGGGSGFSGGFGGGGVSGGGGGTW